MPSVRFELREHPDSALKWEVLRIESPPPDSKLDIVFMLARFASREDAEAYLVQKAMAYKIDQILCHIYPEWKGGE